MSALADDEQGTLKVADSASVRDRALTLLRTAKRIFIIYSNDDLSRASDLRRRILRLRGERKGDRVFLAAESLGVGQDVSPAAVRHEIARSELVVIACGELTAQSPFVADEVEQALAQRRANQTHILPVILKTGVTLPAGIDYSIQAIHRQVLFPALRWVPIAIAAGLVLAAAFSLTYFERARRAEARRAEQTARRLWAGAATARERDDSLLAAHLMAEAADSDASRPSWENAAFVAQTLLRGPRLVAVLEHGGGVVGATLDRGERRILTWSTDGTVRLWDAAALTPIGVPMSAGGAVLGATLDCAEERILSWNRDGSVRLWNAATRQQIGAPITSHVVSHDALVSDYSGRDIPQAGAMFSRNCSRILTWGPDGTARVWDAGTLQAIGAPMQHDWPPVLGATFDADERRILTWGHDATVRLWDASTQRPIGRPMTHTSLVRAASFDREGRQILASDGTVARIWNANTQKQIGSDLWGYMSLGNVMPSAVFTPDEGHILTWGNDGKLRVWDPTTQLVNDQMGHDGPVRGTLVHGNYVVTWGGDGTIRQWQLVTYEPSAQPLKHRAGVEGVALDREARRLLSWSADGSAQLWDPFNSRKIGPPMRHKARVSGARFYDSERRILTWSDDATVRVWELPVSENPVTRMTHQSQVYSAVFDAPERRILSWSGDYTVRLWDALTQTQIGSPMAHEHFATGARFDGSGRRILSWGFDGTARLWDAATQRPIGQPMRHDGSVHGATFDRAERRILTWGDGTVRVWDAERQQVVGPVMPPPVAGQSGWRAAAFDPTERYILTWSWFGRAQLWDASTHQAVGAGMEHGGPTISGAAFDPNGRILTWTTTGAIRLWSVGSQTALGPPMMHGGDVYGAQFTRDARRILSWSKDGTVRLWDAATRQPLGTPMRHERPVAGARFDRGERRILTWSGDSTVRLWDAETRTELGPPMRHDAPVLGAVFDREELRILSWTSRALFLWDADTLQPVGSPLTDLFTADAAFDRSGRRILVSTVAGPIWLTTWVPPWRQGSWRQRVQSETGTRVSTSGEVEALTGSEWRAVRESYDRNVKEAAASR